MSDSQNLLFSFYGSSLILHPYYTSTGRVVIYRKIDAGVYLQRVTLYDQAGKPRKALKILLSRRFHPWEGGEGAVLSQYAAAHFLLGRAALEAGRAPEALGDAEGARVRFRQVAEAQAGLSAATYYQALVLDVKVLKALLPLVPGNPSVRPRPRQRPDRTV